ncbi:double-strand break repair helicase AddA [Pseudoruegeria sp. SK021]|uniref:double-strand break repair helicase AddA n=1 Tax=Pseudoruegeria sp. SK021 TaxID=1933035 RepID=UPI000A231146|nr:double-strand break repair helicase AddA [Pseudoruegeria sp. SK021]OSP55354.1 double-strand break repair helicase AddA [Pseudoruegeria sp. SK021]
MTAPFDDATQRQITAADPTASTWLAANAGSGKTRVLTDRVARLLMAQVPPQNILCLTFTKAAASEMQNRLFSQLGDWAMKPDADLRAALTKLGVEGTLETSRLDAARRLFARAIETPGGLKIQTIHAFCASLLRQFPLESGVSPQFTELDERTQSALCNEVLEELSDGSEASAVDGIAAYLSGDDLDRLTRAILKDRDSFVPPLDLPAALEAHGLPQTFSTDALLAQIFDGDEGDLITSLLPALRAKGGNDATAARKLEPLAARPLVLSDLAVMENVFLFGATAKAPFAAKIDSFPTAPTRKTLGPDLMDRLNDLMQRVEDARPMRQALVSARKTATLHRFAGVFLPAVDARKAQRGWLDFDDLILRARDLLTDPRVADWVLYKLDGGIDHILVDEAQDTSPVQWEVIRLLACEFTAGNSARDDTLRTIFVVGDKKQSIYSFQGADPQEFDRLRQHFDDRLTEAAQQLQIHALEHSFRSSPAVLEVVDATFDGAAAAGVGGTTRHIAFKDQLPGRVDLWPPVEKPEEPDTPDWHRPVDQISPRHENAVLADAIASELRRLIDAGETIPDGKGGRKLLSEGDVLILVQRRGQLFREILRACKRERLRIAGADRLILTKDLAVRDLLALLSFLALPEDDLALATALRSPLFGWSEDGLFQLAQPRRGLLWSALRAQPVRGRTMAILDDLIATADFLRPYDLLERILNRHGMRQALIARLGPDCEEAIDALLGEALTYESTDIPSLTGFLEWMRAEDVEIKRQADASGESLRVMTVHGSKGLEAPVVILPDCASRRASPGSEILITQDGWAAWPPSADDLPDLLKSAKADLQALQAEERLRLLYVAMTRAEVWLWVCAAGELGKSGDSWHDLVHSAMALCDAGPMEFPTGNGLRHARGDWDGGDVQGAAEAGPSLPALPDWTSGPAPLETEPPKPVAPSNLGGAKALAGDLGRDEATAKLWGRSLHLLLEHLPNYPPASWPNLTPDLLRMGVDGETDLDQGALLAEATRVLTNPDLAFLFHPDTLAEVDISAHLTGLDRRMHGIIDRLVVSQDRVLAVDFKSNSLIPEQAASVPDGLLRQMGAYTAALTAIYPGKAVETALLWTASARLMPLPTTLVLAALDRAEPQ